MKKIEDYINLPYRMELIPDLDEGGFVVLFPELKGCMSSGETAQSAIENAMDAKREWLCAALESCIEIPLPETDAEYSGQFKLRIPKSLHRKLSMESRREGISMNQYCVYLLSQGVARG